MSLKEGQKVVEVKKKSFFSGSQYVGEMVGGKRHGKGKKTWKNGDWYDGFWQNDKREGKGVFHTESNVYDGEWVMGVKHGHGICVYAAGDKYEGEWRDGQANGHGTYTKPNGNQFKGEYKGNKCNGYGVYTFANGDCYRGEWKDSRKHGNGTIDWADGRSFEGEFNMDCPVKGKYVTADGIFENEYCGTKTFSSGAQSISQKQIGTPEEAEAILVSVRASAVARKLARKQAGYEDVDDETGGIDYEEGTVAGGATSSVAGVGPSVSNPAKSLAKPWEGLTGNETWSQALAEATGIKSDNHVVASRPDVDLPWCPAHLACPLSHELMLDPVVAADGVTYDRRPIQRWLQRNNWSPSTGEPLENLQIKPHASTRAAALAFAQSRDWQIHSSAITVDNVAGDTLMRLGSSVMVRGTLRHRKVELKVAVKIWPDLEPRLEEERYRMECAVLQRVTGLQGTCQVLGTSEVNGRRCIISKLQHRSLQDMLRGKDVGGPGARLDLKTTLRIAIDVAEALVQVHGAGACYLDLHPANIVFDKHDSLFLSNFRLARILPEGCKSACLLTTEGMSPSYLAPEQFRPEENQNIGYKSDIWGLGGIMMRMLSGGPPFAGMENDAIEQRVCDDRRLPPIDFASIHQGLAKIIESCFQYDPDARPDAGELLQKLKSFQISQTYAPTTLEAGPSVAMSPNFVASSPSTLRHTPTTANRSPMTPFMAEGTPVMGPISEQGTPGQVSSWPTPQSAADQRRPASSLQSLLDMEARQKAAYADDRNATEDVMLRATSSDSGEPEAMPSLSPSIGGFSVTGATQVTIPAIDGQSYVAHAPGEAEQGGTPPVEIQSGGSPPPPQNGVAASSHGQPWTVEDDIVAPVLSLQVMSLTKGTGTPTPTPPPGLTTIPTPPPVAAPETKTAPAFSAQTTTAPDLKAAPTPPPGSTAAATPPPVASESRFHL